MATRRTLTVAHIAYPTESGWRWGAASHHLATAAEGTTQRVYIERNERFRLPADASRDVIMIGPGTGVAPFRGFVQERAAIGANGRNWLLFGNPHLRSDFLYQLEWQQALRDGRLQRLDVAFSRDGASKHYVQHRLHEHGRDVFSMARKRRASLRLRRDRDGQGRARDLCCGSSPNKRGGDSGSRRRLPR